MGKVFRQSDYTEKLLRIQPEGWINDLVFEYGLLHGSGQALNSIGIRLNDNAGGVLTNDDLMAILNMIIAHFERIAREAKEAVNDLQPSDRNTTSDTANAAPTNPNLLNNKEQE